MANFQLRASLEMGNLCVRRRAAGRKQKIGTD
jgi:hypothetical protein